MAEKEIPIDDWKPLELLSTRLLISTARGYGSTLRIRAFQDAATLLECALALDDLLSGIDLALVQSREHLRQ
jgi:hypothetical protein